MKDALLDSMIYRNIFSITEVALETTNINIGNIEKRNRIKSSFLTITRRQKNRIMDGLMVVPKEKRLSFIIGCFKENSTLLKQRIEILEELSLETKALCCTEIDKYTDEKIQLIDGLWKENQLDNFTELQMKDAVDNWKFRNR